MAPNTKDGKAKSKKTIQATKKMKPAAAKKTTTKKSAAPKSAAVAKKNNRKMKAAADPNAPKKPLSGFMKFSQEHRAIVKGANPDLSFGGIGKKLGDMWRTLSGDEKAAYKPVKSVVDMPIAAVEPVAPAIVA
ncbi:unnamed protein product [Cylindrotheca closterium]|uniref:HMG box domain-containing protein n=1 Tax=Cylindrotheca closterium TaxID=2856 RepID=A0AAD2G7C7_9STRA|nr:unnamed protein product [Cylindrotheca closterium]